MPDVSDKEKEILGIMAESASWKRRTDMSWIDDKNIEAMNSILAEKPYFSESKLLYSRVNYSFYPVLERILTSRVTANKWFRAELSGCPS